MKIEIIKLPSSDSDIYSFADSKLPHDLVAKHARYLPELILYHLHSGQPGEIEDLTPSAIEELRDFTSSHPDLYQAYCLYQNLVEALLNANTDGSFTPQTYSPSSAQYPIA